MPKIAITGKGGVGKTTTTAMIVQTLRTGGIDCGYIIGSDVPNFGSGAAGSAPTCSWIGFACQPKAIRCLGTDDPQSEPRK